MTREQAIDVLISRYNSSVIRSRTNDDEWRLATDAVIVALRGPEPDPDTGLVPCGCGGDVILGADYCDGYWVECVSCQTKTGYWESGDEHEAMGSYDKTEAVTAWNTAMGWRGNDD